MPVIETHGLTKVFRRPDKGEGLKGSVKHLFVRKFTEHVAVNGVELSVEPGEAVAYVGPNGAGKSTTIKLLTGILVPSSGEVRVAGVVPHKDRVANARNIGVLFGQRTQLWWDLPVRESLSLLRDIYGISTADYKQRIAHYDEVLGLGELLPLVARKLSLGQRMRADLAAAMLHRPGIVYLDEPTIGLDIAVKDRVRAFLRQICADGTTLMLTTHDLGDIEDVCQRIVIIDEGRIIHDGSIAAVKDTFARQRELHVQFRIPRDGRPIPVEEVAALVPGAEVETSGDDREHTEFTIRFDRFELTAAQVITSVLPLGEVVDFRLDEPAIEDVIRKVYAGDLDLSRDLELSGDAP